MPTTRPRHLVTETDELTRALDDAATEWPGLSRPQLLVRLALRGHEAATRAADERRRERLAVLERNAGALTGVYPYDEIERGRDDWPA